MPIAVLVALAGCAHPVERGLQDAADASRAPPALRVVYDDHHALWGGRRIAVHGDGRIEVRRWRPGQPEDEPDVWRGRLPPERVAGLVRLLVRIEAWDQRVEKALPRLDEGRARLHLRIGDERATIWEWANDLEAVGRLVLVRDLLEELVADARRERAGDTG
ncbi:MAG: hypothetical protein ACODAU_06225 [Myxococcota bacterium]